jgi:hypothetical protein
MRKHNGMRPQDIAILLKLLALKDKEWQLTGLSHELYISISEISESLNRSRLAKLIDYDKKKVSRHNLMEFLEHGIKYVFPQQPGTMVRGIPTAHSQQATKGNFVSEINYVWPDPKGKTMGLLIEPLYPKQVHAIKMDAFFYELMALLDMVRVGKIREVNYAVEQLKKYILP